MLDHDKNFKCFICNIEKDEFIKQGISFEKHCEVEHNHWNYIYFLTHITVKSYSDFNGTETYIYDKWKQGNISWFPIGRAGALNDDQHDDKKKDLEHYFVAFLKRILKKRNKVEQSEGGMPGKDQKHKKRRGSFNHGHAAGKEGRF